LKSFLRPALSLLSVGVTFAVAGRQPAFAGIDVYLSAPKSQATVFTNTLTETFEGFTAGIHTTSMVATIGTYQLSTTTKLAVLADDQYGTGTGQYVSLGAQSGTSAPVTLQLSSAQSYFGFSWNAGDANNEISFYNSGQRVGYYATSQVIGLLSHTTVTTLDGQTYQSSAYYGKPTTGVNSGEPYAFLNFIYTGGAFDKIVFSNSNSIGTGFESDNHTIRTVAPTAPGSFVHAGNASTPEPGTLTLLSGLGLSGGIFLKRRRRKAC
jgi:hypothetical protein